MRAGETVIEECDAGMIKLVVPIFVGDEFVGAVGACGMRFEDSDIDAFLVNKMTDMAEEQVASLAGSVPSVPRAQAEALGRYIRDRVDAILTSTSKRG
jgi:ligand-binding sensor protein